MKFRTEITIGKAKKSLSHSDCMLLLGSCFAENIGNKLQSFRFNTLTNPLGIAYNPIALHKILSFSSTDIESITFNKEKDLYFHFDFHSDFSSPDLSKAKSLLEEGLRLQSHQLKKEPILLLSYGTAWVHEHKKSKLIVNNCHKQSSTLFSKRLLSVEEIANSWAETYKHICEQHQTPFKVIFTLSPVRHLKDGFHENQLSKATLLLAIQKICNTYDNCEYFPSYEIVMDDLRDYRFFNNDLIHPNEMAINYIWEQFSKTFFSAQTNQLNSEILKLNQSIQHRAFNEQSGEHQLFLKKLYNQLLAFQEEHSIDFEKEINLIRQRILPSN